MDHNRRNRSNRVARKSKITLSCQIKWLTSRLEGVPQPGNGGIDEEQEGYAMVLTSDLKALSQPIKRGDKVVKIEDFEVSLFVKRLEYGSHYGGKFTLAKIVFEDRTSQD